MRWMGAVSQRDLIKKVLEFLMSVGLIASAFNSHSFGFKILMPSMVWIFFFWNVQIIPRCILPSHVNSFPDTKQFISANVARSSQLQRYPLFLTKRKQTNMKIKKNKQNTGIECYKKANKSMWKEEGLVSNVSLRCHSCNKCKGDENNIHDHQLLRFLIVTQILPLSTLVNV